MKKILFVVTRMLFDRPREIRAKRIIEAFPKDYEVHLLSFDFDNEIKFDRKVFVHKMPLGWISRKIFNLKSRRFCFLFDLVRKFVAFPLRYFFYPDIFKIEAANIRRHLISLERKHEFDYVVTSVMPFTLLKFGKLIKDFGSLWVVDLGDPLYKNAAKNCFFSSNRAYNFEEKFLKYCDALIVTNEETKKHYSSCFNKTLKDKIFVIPQGAVIPRQELKKEIDYKKKKRIILTYAGIFYKNLREPTELFEAVRRFDKIPIVLKIFPKPTKYPNTCPEKIEYYEMMSNDKVFEQYLASDILVFIDNAHGMQSSGKIFELLACKKPILFIYESEKSVTKKNFEKFKGIFFAKNSFQEIVSALEKIYNSFGKIEFDFPLEELSWDKRAKEFEKVLDIVRD